MEYKNEPEIVGIGSHTAEKGTTEDTQELKLFKRNGDDIVCNVKVRPEKLKSTLSLRNLYKKPLHKKPNYSSGTRR